MFSKAALFVAASLAVFVAASPVPDNVDSCNTGYMACCNQVYEENSTEAKDIISLFSATLQGVTGHISTQCSPITGVGLSSGSSCNAMPVCCDNNNFNGLVVVGCTPINLGL
ncbi:hydrophobin [Infundibulicybe gibba]|nr:hydrophobin [Infundibulicybe gibba]